VGKIGVFYNIYLSQICACFFSYFDFKFRLLLFMLLLKDENSGSSSILSKLFTFLINFWSFSFINFELLNLVDRRPFFGEELSLFRSMDGFLELSPIGLELILIPFLKNINLMKINDKIHNIPQHFEIG